MAQSQLPVPPAPPSADAPSIGVGDLTQFGHVAPDMQRAQRRELMEQLQTLENSRGAVLQQLRQLPAKSPDRGQLEAQVATLDGRIAAVDGMLAGTQGFPMIGGPEVIVQPPYYQERMLPKDIFVLSGIFLVVTLLPLSIAIALRIMKRGAAKVAALPSDLAERFTRMETAIEATAIEVERIGEGQRYLTRVLGDRKAEELLERPRAVARDRITPH